MINYAAAFGCLHGIIDWLEIECRLATKPIDGKMLAAKLDAAIKTAIERGKNYDNDHVNPDGTRE